MNKTVRINNENKIKYKEIEYLNPDYIYIPLYENDVVNIKIGDLILKEDLIISNRHVYSPISGKFVGYTKSLNEYNKEVTSLVLENDFEENIKNKKGALKYINEYDSKSLIDILNKFDVINTDFKDIKTLIVNGIDADPFEKGYSYIINNYTTKILDAIDALVTSLNIPNVYLAINNHNENNVINLTNHLGTYPNIKLKMLPDIYPIGFESIVIKNTLPKKLINDNYLYLTVEDMLNIYNTLKRQKPITQKTITIAGDAIEGGKIVDVKIGTSLNDLIKNTCEITKENYYVVVNGLIKGMTLKSLNSIITKDIKSIFLNTLNEEQEKKCINCGLCNLKCPVGLNPKYIKEHRKANKDKCIHCGLCTFICPAKINFKPYLERKDNDGK